MRAWRLAKRKRCPTNRPRSGGPRGAPQPIPIRRSTVADSGANAGAVGAGEVGGAGAARPTGSSTTRSPNPQHCMVVAAQHLSRWAMSDRLHSSKVTCTVGELSVDLCCGAEPWATGADHAAPNPRGGSPAPRQTSRAAARASGSILQTELNCTRMGIQDASPSWRRSV
jgi:hypothetical protein